MRKKRWFLFIVITIIILAINAYLNTKIFTRNYDILSKKIPTELDGFRIAQLSDIHSIRSENDTIKIISKIQKMEPDIIVITGDLIDSQFYRSDKNENLKEDTHRIPDELTLKFVTGLLEISPVFFVYGNHEMMLLDNPERNPFMLALMNLGVNIVNNQAIIIEKENARLTIAGLQDPATLYKDDDYADMEGSKDKTQAMLENVAKETDFSNFTILLAHRPEYFELYAAYPIDLVLTGHAHGGQVRLPLIGGLYAPNQGWFPKYTSGLFQKDQMKMVVNRGIGNSVAPFRFGNPPEIVCITLKSPELVH